MHDEHTVRKIRRAPGVVLDLIDAPADDHGEPCMWCGREDRPTVADVHYLDDERIPSLASTCLHCVLPFVEDRHHDGRGRYEALVQLSTAPVDERLYTCVDCDSGDMTETEARWHAHHEGHCVADA